MSEKIEYKTLNDRAYEAIKNGLITGQFTPRQVLVIRTLAETYGISTTPVREALQRLVGEGQLIMLANRSVAVPDWDPEKFIELFRIRRELEGLAGELAATRMPQSALNEVVSLTEQIDECIRRTDHGSYILLNQAFHFTIYKYSDSPRLVRIIENLWGEVGVYMAELFAGGDFESIANVEHHAIVQALRLRDPAGVRHHMIKDITKAADFLLPRIRDLSHKEAGVTS